MLESHQKNMKVKYFTLSFFFKIWLFSRQRKCVIGTYMLYCQDFFVMTRVMHLQSGPNLVHFKLCLVRTNQLYPSNVCLL